MDELEQRFVVAEAEARLFGTPRELVRVGRFELRARLGAGGLGVVYAAHDPELDRDVAIKLLRRDDREQLLVEARAMAKLAHPNVVAVHEIGVHDGRVFVAMERVVGATARMWLQTPRGWRDIVSLYLQAGRGLASAHAAGIVHRDFKPDNVLVGDDGRARVTDFGLAAPAGELGSGGTPAYMPPERGAATPAGDQYALAVSLHEALAGGRDAEPPPDSPVPRRIWRALARGKARDPAARWPSLDAMLAAIEAPPKRRVLRTIAWSIVIAVLATALAGAVLQFFMFRDWMGK